MVFGPNRLEISGTVLVWKSESDTCSFVTWILKSQRHEEPVEADDEETL
jgi:hypothetical protein